jgi:electron transfer flavoprotein beta subunit
MKILVCISVTPDTTARIAFKDDATAFDTTGVTMIMNPYDEWYALVRAIDLAVQTAGTVTLFHVGLADSEQVMRKGLAIGGDDAVRIDAHPTSAGFVAAQAASYAKANGYDLVFLGKETIAYNGSEVAAMVAEHLDWPLVSYASKLDLAGQTATIERDIEGGIETIELDLPFVISAAKGLAEQRIPNMMGIMKAKTKPLSVIAPVAYEETVSVARFDLRAGKSAVKLVDADDMDELVRLLHTEAKVI